MSRFRFFIYGALVLMSVQAVAHEGHIFFPANQVRYQNDIDQSLHEVRNYVYDLGVQFSDRYLVQGEYVELSQGSTSGAIQITSKFREFSLAGGYIVYSKALHESYNIYFDLVPMAYLGENVTMVETTISGTTQSSDGELNFNYGLGTIFNLKLNFLILQADARYAISRSYSPGGIFIYGGRVGIRFGF